MESSRCEFKTRRAVALAKLLFALLILIDFRSAWAQSTLAQQTVVVFNRGLPESVALAKFYAEKRGIAPDHLLGLECSREEEITREAYDSTIAEPLRTKFCERNWWQFADGPDARPQVQASAIHFVAVIKGVPLKIKAFDQPYPGDKPGPGPIQNRNEAAVDSELCALAFFSAAISGALNNPYFQSTRSIAEFHDGPVLLVSRLEAPEFATVRRMIVDAIEAEKTGLGGRAFVDGAHNTAGGLALGDAWLSTIVDQLRKAGIPVIYDETPEIFVDDFPVTGCALYYGWYTGNIAGPFKRADFRFVPGAIAAHIHSFSATTLRDPHSGWAGPLIMHGAAATIGNVYEPYLQFTENLDILNERLLRGFTWAESVSMGSSALSWMNIALGDPLYRPFSSSALEQGRTAAKGNVDWRNYREFVAQNSSLAADAFQERVRLAAVRDHNGPMLEDIGLMQLRGGNFANAISALQTARSVYRKRDDILRCVLEECDAWRKSGKPKRAAEVARDVLRVVPDAPAAPLLRKFTNVP